ncbi:major facilitator superfamily protein, partial [Aphelenchoides avenae]
MQQSERWIARISGVDYSEEVKPPIVHRLGLGKLLRNRQWLRRIAVLWAMWFTASICGYAIDLNSSNISGNLFLNQLLFSIITMASKNVLLAVDTFHPSFSRRNLHQYAQTVVIVCMITLTLLVMFHDHRSIWILVLNMVGITFIEYTWDACYLCAVESMPSNMRATSVGSCSLVARIGAILSPVLAFLNSTWAPSAYLTVVLLGTLNLAISCKWLSETKGVNLDEVNFDEDDESSVG